MTLDATRAQRQFFATGRRERGLSPADGLRPALFAPYADLDALRYDYPLVLVDEGPQAGIVRSLSGIVDDLLLEAAPRGIDGEKLRRHVLRLERELRHLARGGGRLQALWSQAALRIGKPSDASAEAVLSAIGEKLDLDGDIAGCGDVARIVTHFWSAARARKLRALRADVDRVTARLSDILRAAFVHSEAGQSAEALCAGVGGGHRADFDFAAMSRLVSRRAPKDELTASRRKRIEWALATLRAQPFGGYAFAYDNCAEAARTFRERLPAMATVVKALGIAELEADNRYDEGKHDAFFDGFDETALSDDDIALFPDYLVCIPPARNDAAENAGLMEMLSAGMPVKVLVETSDLYEEAVIGAGHFAFGVRSVRLANTATGLGGVYVIQTTSASLPALRERIIKGFSHRGAALFSVYTGVPETAREVPAFLSAAAAMESRAFPAFAYDPLAGDNQAARFILADNPQADADWPLVPLEYADDDGQRVRLDVPFTYVDFVLCDRRYAKHFAHVERSEWNERMLPAGEWLARDAKSVEDCVPYVLAVDGDNALHRVIADQRLVNAAVRARTLWHRLQEQGGIHNSHAERLLERERAAWQAKAASEEPAPATAPAGAATEPAAAAEAPAEHSPDEAWIETSRCPSCNECQLINDKMFVYNENKQAYIADVKAGTYRQLVEAAESCQVSIIHPGKPWNPNEPGLAELVERARPFQ
jgi:hypothetical protein